LCTTFLNLRFCSELSAGFSLGSLLQDGLLDTTSLRKGNLGMVSRSYNENVSNTGTETISLHILDGGDVEGTIVFLDVDKLSNTPSVMSLGDHNHGSNSELKDISHLSGGNINLNGILGLDIRVGVTNGASIVSDGYRYLVGSHVGLLDLA